MEQFERYWMVAAACLVSMAWLVRMVLRERLTLQGSLSFLAFLGLLVVGALLPAEAGRISRWLGFTLPANFLFSMLIGSLALLHLSALVWLSRVEMRSIALVQELAILQEKLDRALSGGGLGKP